MMISGNLDRNTSWGKRSVGLKCLGARPTMITGIIVLALFFGLGGYWSISAELDGAVVSTGELVVSGNRTRVQHVEGGTIKRILVNDGDKVKKDDPLIFLEDIRIKAQVLVLENEYFEAIARAARLRAEQFGYKNIQFPEEILKVANQAPFRDIIIMQERLFESRRNSLDGQVEILSSRIPQYESMIGGLDAQLAALEVQLETFREELGITEELFNRGFERRTRLLQLQRQVSGAEGEIGDLLEKRAQTRLAISEVEMRVIDLKISRMLSIEEELTPLLSAIQDLSDRLDAAKSELFRTVIRAPLDGVVVGRTVHNVGAVVQPGEILMSIVPIKSILEVYTKIAPLDIELVTIGQSARVVFSAFNQNDVKSIDAVVKRISADRLQDKNTGELFYEGVLHIVESQLDTINTGNISLVPGMPVEVYINTVSRTPLNYLFEPIKDSFRRSFRE